MTDLYSRFLTPRMLGRWLFAFVFLAAGALLATKYQTVLRAEVAPPVEAEPNTLTPAEEGEGWRLLFDGTSLDGWRGLNQEGVPEGHWEVRDGAIHKIAREEAPRGADGKPVPGGDLMTTEAFDDFEFVLEWKIATAANSCIKYNVDERMSKGRGALGFEYQIIDDVGHPPLDGPTHTTGALYDMIPPDPAKHLNPPGTYNETRIVFRGTHGEHWLNGVKVVEFDLGTPRFDSLLAASKYRDIKGFADRRRGHIVLQDHGDEAWFRNIKIRSLPPQ